MKTHLFAIQTVSEDYPIVSITITDEMELPEVVEAFEAFLYAAGYRLPDGAHLGYEHDDEETNPVY